MKKTFLLFIHLLLSALLPANAQEWIRVWSDEFNYNGLPDPEKWIYDVGGNGWGNQESQFYTYRRPENARVEKGSLVIEARKEKYQEKDFTSARLKTLGLQDWKYARIEVRAQIPTGRGLWSAIWMLPSEPAYGNWPSSGEIDIMENVGYEPNTSHFTIHTEAYNHKINTQIGSNINLSSPFTQYHVYSVEWFPDSLKGYVDDSLYFTFRKSGDYKTWPFDQKFHLLLNTAVGGTWGGTEGIDSTVFPQQFLVDYVRVYQQPEGNGPYTVTTSNTPRGTILKTPDAATYQKGTLTALKAIANEGYEFRRWYGTRTGVKDTMTLPMYFNYTQKAEFVRTGEMLQNPSFLGATAFWDNYGTSITAPDDTLTVPVPVSTKNPWDIQMSQKGLLLEKGKTYRLLLTAKTLYSGGKSINIAAGISQDPWTTYMISPVALNTTWKTFEYQFTMPVTDSNARISVDYGGTAGDVRIAEISLTKVQTATGLKNENDLQGWNLYPTLVENTLKAEFLQGQLPAVIRLYTADGLLIKSVPVNTTSAEISMEGKQPGLYLVEVTTSGRRTVRKIIRQ